MECKKVSFIIPAKNEENNIKKCIDSINNLNYPKKLISIYLVDNGSTDNTVAIASNLGAEILLFPNVTISRLRNEGARVSEGEYLAFIDADVSISIDWIDVCLYTMDTYSSPFVGSSPQIPSKSTWVEKMWHLQIQSRDDICQRPWIASMNMMITKHCFFDVGGFDEKLMTCEDVDLGKRVVRKNYKIVYNKNIKAIHYGEAKTIFHLYTKEKWRGSSGYASYINDPFNLKEIISLLSVIFFILSFLFLFYFMFTLNFISIVYFITLILTFPILRSVSVIFKSKFKYNPYVFVKLIFIFFIYYSARSISFIDNFFKMIRLKV